MGLGSTLRRAGGVVRNTATGIVNHPGDALAVATLPGFAPYLRSGVRGAVSRGMGHVTGEADVARSERQAAAAAAADANTEGGLMARIDRLYGITPAGSNAAQTSEAQRNHAALEQILSGQNQAYNTEGMAGLNNQFTRSWRGETQQLAGQGLAGGSVDRSARRRMLADLFTGRGRVALGAQAADRSARTALNNQRMNLQRQVKLGAAPSLDTLNAVGDQRSSVDEAYSGLGRAAIGDLFANAGNVYYSGQEAAGYGRAGPDAFRLGRTTRPSTTGNYLS